jgi:hypothetical protein
MYLCTEIQCKIMVYNSYVKLFSVWCMYLCNEIQYKIMVYNYVKLLSAWCMYFCNIMQYKNEFLISLCYVMSLMLTASINSATSNLCS